MGFWDFRKKQDFVEGRTVKEPDLSEFVVPLFVNPKPIRKNDQILVEKLRQEFLDAGVIDDEYESDDSLSNEEAESLVKLFEEVSSTAKNEKDFHEEVYFDENVYTHLDEYEEKIVFDDEFPSYSDQIRMLTSDYDDDF